MTPEQSFNKYQAIHQAHIDRFTLGAQLRNLLEARSLGGSVDTLNGREEEDDAIADLRSRVWAAEALALKLDPNQRHIPDSILVHFPVYEDEND